jgi:alkanesulfonate monooxygenase SsuD/methylene tetrahydromethanopterin reductase-like flavin-dependent oxidoreductase (luciferase family)
MLPLLWGKGSPSFQGSTMSAAELTCYPRPVQEKIPILIGGSGEKRTLRLVAKYGDAANLFGKPETITHKVDVLRNHCADVERDPAEIEVGHLVTAMAAPDGDTLRNHIGQLRGRNQSVEQFVTSNNAGLPEDLVDLFGSYRDAGASHSVVALPNVHLDGSIEAFGEVISAFAQ